MRRIAFWGLTPVAALVAALAGGPATAAATPCANAPVRAEQNAQHLPGCRGYEMVSPRDKGGFSVTRPDGSNFVTGNHANATAVVSDGGGINYVAGGATADPESQSGAGISYTGLRGPNGWTTRAISPPLGPPAMPVIGLTGNLRISSDGARSIVQTPVQLVPGAPACAAALCAGTIYLQDNATRERKLIDPGPFDGASPAGGPSVAAATPELHQVLFTDSDALLPQAIPGVDNLYEWTDNGTLTGDLRLVGVDENGDVLPGGAAAGQGPSPSVNETRRTISADGRRIFFVSDGQLYARTDGTTTVRVSASQRSTVDPDGPQPATFWTADAQKGSSVFFTSAEKLTDDAQATVDQPDLYRYDFGTETLTDITAGPGPANVLGVIGASDDGTDVYFGATAQLVPGKGAAGKWNVYHWSAGAGNGSLTFVAALQKPTAAVDENNWLRDLTQILPVQVSANGRYLALLSSTALTEASTGGEIQVYRYDAQTGDLDCASCGAGPAAQASFRQVRPDAMRVVSDQGQVAFQTSAALVPSDTNGQRDVYVYDGQGIGLISTGKSPELATFMGMSVSGDDIFFATRRSVVATDGDTLIDLYDARVGGGFAQPVVAAPCDGDPCQGQASPPPPLLDPRSRDFLGAGNVIAAPRKAKESAKQVRAWAKRWKRKVTRFTVVVTAPAAGKIRVRGSRIRTAKRTARKARKYTLRVSLNTKAKRTLRRHHRVKVRSTVTFAPKKGTASKTTVTLTVKEHK